MGDRAGAGASRSASGARIGWGSFQTGVIVSYSSLCGVTVGIPTGAFVEVTEKSMSQTLHECSRVLDLIPI